MHPIMPDLQPADRECKNFLSVIITQQDSFDKNDYTSVICKFMQA